jgi:hypothetical protein
MRLEGLTGLGVFGRIHACLPELFKLAKRA